MSLEEVIKQNPWIKWFEPISIHVVGKEDKHIYACRICIGMRGFKANTDKGFQTKEECQTHIDTEHKELREKCG